MNVIEMEKIVRETRVQTESFKREMADIMKVSPLKDCRAAYASIGPLRGGKMRQRRELPVTGYKK